MPDAVERHAEHRFGHAVLGGDRGDVRVMVLDADRGHGEFRRKLDREPRAEEVRMQVVRDRRGPDLEHALQMIDGFFERDTARRVVQIADVLRQESLRAARQTRRVLQEAAGGEDRGPGASELDRRGRVAAGAADEGEGGRRAAGGCVGRRASGAFVGRRPSGVGR
jgi:hypothetical protein